MRRRPIVNPQAAVAQAVADLQNKFEYPDLDTQPLPALVGGGGGAPTVVVAASDATDLSKGKADFICNGVNDQDVIQAAISEIAFGRILLTEGIFNIDVNAIDTGFGKHLQGLGPETRLVTSATTGTMINLGNQSVISDLTLEIDPSVSNTLIGITTDIETQVHRVRFESLNVCIQVTDDDCLIFGCYADTSDEFVTTSGSRSRIQVVANDDVGGINLGVAFYCIVANNILLASGSTQIVFAAGGDTNLVDGNTLIGPVAGFGIDVRSDFSSVTNNRLYNYSTGFIFVDASNCIVANNFLESGSSSAEGIVISGATKVQLVANHLYRVPGHGIRLTDSGNCLVVGNLVDHIGTATTNTFDGIILSGDSDLNHVSGNKIIGKSSAPQPRYAINVSAATCDNNAVVGNNFSDPGGTDYGTARFNDAGTGTITLWSSGGPNGDNIN